tara:strand:- start:393 stop:698 length:306 start_codon:yes stop_codon:yes gene_type:complete
MQVYELHIIRKLKMGTKKDKTLKTLSGISKPKYNISESHIREYFKITKDIYGGRYKEIVEEFIKNKNIMDEISKEDFKLFNRLLQYHDIFRQIPTQKMEKN